jgi:vitamin B12 transporter
MNDSPVNVGKASIVGLTLAYEGWFSNYHMRANADFQDPKNEDGNGKTLARRAKEHGAIWLGQKWGDLEIGSEIVASSKRFNDADNVITLAGYALINLTAKYKINSDWSANARINNLLDKEYSLSSTAASWQPSNPAYNTPGANIFVSMTYTPKF